METDTATQENHVAVSLKIKHMPPCIPANAVLCIYDKEMKTYPHTKICR
jgi:hypothetical protein